MSIRECLVICSAIYNRRDVTPVEWDMLWEFAIQHDLAASHWRAGSDGLTRLRWREAGPQFLEVEEEIDDE